MPSSTIPGDTTRTVQWLVQHVKALERRIGGGKGRSSFGAGTTGSRLYVETTGSPFASGSGHLASTDGWFAHVLEGTDVTVEGGIVTVNADGLYAVTAQAGLSVGGGQSIVGGLGIETSALATEIPNMQQGGHGDGIAWVSCGFTWFIAEGTTLDVSVGATTSGGGDWNVADCLLLVARVA